MENDNQIDLIYVAKHGKTLHMVHIEYKNKRIANVPLLVLVFDSLLVELCHRICDVTSKLIFKLYMVSNRIICNRVKQNIITYTVLVCLLYLN